MTQWLTGLDVVRIQESIFASNRLRDIVAGSELVDEVTAANRMQRFLSSGQRVVFGGGGNAVVVSPDRAGARDFVGEYSHALLDEAPGLEVVAAHEPLDPAGQLASLDRLQLALDRAKHTGVISAPLDGLSVTAACAETQMAATALVREPDPKRPHRWLPASGAVAARRSLPAATDWPVDPNLYRDRFYEQGISARPYLPIKHEDIAANGNQLAIVHIDGTRIGKRLHDALHEVAGRDVIDQLGRASKAIDGVMEKAEDAIIERIVDAVRIDPRGSLAVCSQRSGQTIPLRADSGRVALPYRRVVRAGDDLTFVCDGRLGLTLARAALESLEHQPVAELGRGPLAACAGVAIARAGVPFARLYRTAEAACREAKRCAAERGASFAIDWHVGPPVNDLAAHRRSSYRRGNVSLTGRPYPLDPAGASSVLPHSFEMLDDEILGPNPNKAGFAAGLLGTEWQGHRSRLHALEDAIRHSEADATALLTRWGLHDPTQQPAWLRQAGFDSGREHNVLLDAIELSDLHVPLP